MANPQQLAQALMQGNGTVAQPTMINQNQSVNTVRDNPMGTLLRKFTPFLDSSSLAPAVNPNVTSLIPSYNQSGLQYNNPDVQNYYKSVGRPLYLSGPTNNAMINDMSHQLQTNGGGIGQFFNSAFSWQPTKDKQSIYQQWANQINQNSTGQ